MGGASVVAFSLTGRLPATSACQTCQCDILLLVLLNYPSPRILCPGSILLSGGLDGSVFISKGLPAEMTMPAPVLPKVGASFDLDTPDDLQQLDEVSL